MPTETHQYRKTRHSLQSKHRLADISHHFLSDSDERTAVWHSSHIIPVLLGSKSDDRIVYQLEHAFNHQQRSSMVLNIEGGLSTSQSLKQRIPKHFSNRPVTPNEKQPTLPDYCLIPVTSPPTILALQCERLVIAVHASLPGIRIAYNQLSFLASLKTNFKVCIVFYGARTENEAKRFFSFLLGNAQSLLELELESGGYVLQDTGVGEKQESGIIKVAQHIADKFLERKKPLHSSSLNAPSGASSYLS